jgi:hypothetical protein
MGTVVSGSIVSQPVGGGGSSTAVFAITTPVLIGDLLICCPTNSPGITPPNFALTDTSTNTRWTRAITIQASNGMASEIWYCWNALGAPSGVTISAAFLGSSGGFESGGNAFIIRGAQSSFDPLDQKASQASTFGNIAIAGPVTPTAPGTAVVFYCSQDGTITPSPGFTELSNLGICDIQSALAVSGTPISGTAGSVGFAAADSALIAVFKDSGFIPPVPILPTDVIFMGMI